MGSGSTAAWCVPAELEAAGSDNVADVPGGTGVETGSRISSAIANAAAVLGGSTQGGSSGGGARAAGEQQQWRATPLLERAVQVRREVRCTTWLPAVNAL